MDIIILPFFVFLELFKWILIIDIVLSWLPLFGIQVIIPFFHAILSPVYTWIRRYLPVTFGSIDFSAFVMLVVLEIIQWMLIRNFPTIVLNIPYLPIL